MTTYAKIDATKPPAKLLVGEYKRLKAQAYAQGMFGYEFNGEFVFRREAYERAIQDEKTVIAFLDEAQ